MYRITHGLPFGGSEKLTGQAESLHLHPLMGKRGVHGCVPPPLFFGHTVSSNSGTDLAGTIIILFFN